MHSVYVDKGSTPANTPILTVDVAEKTLAEGAYFIDISFVWTGEPRTLWRIVDRKAVNTGYHYEVLHEPGLLEELLSPALHPPKPQRAYVRHEGKDIM
jgi:hypothetical protein